MEIRTDTSDLCQVNQAPQQMWGRVKPGARDEGSDR